MTEIPAGFSEEIDMSHPANRGDDDLPIGPAHTVTDINGVLRRGWEIAAVEVTEEMIEVAIFRAMMSVMPTQLISPAEDALRRELDAANRQAVEWYENCCKSWDEQAAWKSRHAEVSALLIERTQERDRALATIQMYENDRAGVLFSATNLPEDIERDPDPIVNAIRPRETDRRRVGG